MGFYSDAWLREARNRITSQANQTESAQNLTAQDFDKLADAVEKAIKAALIESHGSIPQEHDHKKLVPICRSTGVWDVLPPALKNLVQEIDSYQTAIETDAASSNATPTPPEKLQRYFSIARRLIDYMEYHVIGNDSVLRRLRVA
jgi:HEPN domain-containing protein